MTNRKEYAVKHNITDHGDHPRLLEYDPKNKIIDVFVYRDPGCPYPYTTTNTDDPWHHQGFYLKNFLIYLEQFFEENNLPYEVIKK